ncbi:hypothetical protein EV195_110111 [Tenacibaculum skagerrakense]|uniref:Uncharacterized protein n=1 Tax=Tenacibaculum skagerrakense TaxID=186571 RepID=A0A4R2NMX9_9FLAO|nr:hypothetical protein EV195_110111 [Tenacibaculum skagerrakense]
MKNILKISSVFIACVILLTHVFTLIHSFDHSNKHSSKNISKTVTYKDSQISEKCNLCDIYLNSEIPILEEVNYSLPIVKKINNKVIFASEQFTSEVLFSKNSRAPPTLFS